MGLIKANTPMMKQFNAIKVAHPDCIVFFRAGDFYEMFGEDALQASEILSIALTTRNKNTSNAVPMCGVPHHSYESYLNRLTAAGVKVAICEQMEEATPGKGVVRREVVRVVTAGTTLSDQLIDPDRNHYLAAVQLFPPTQPIGVALVDISTGQFEVIEFERESKPGGRQGEGLWNFFLRERPREVLVPEPRSDAERARIEHFRRELTARLRLVEEGLCSIEEVSASWFAPGNARRRLETHLKTSNLAGFGVEDMDSALGAAGAVLAYLSGTQRCELAHLTTLRRRSEKEGMWLDQDTVHHLELFENPSPGGRRHTLFHVLNRTATPMGARLLRQWMAQPLLDKDAIQARLDSVEELAERGLEAERLRGVLNAVRDLERCIGRVSLPTVGVADLLALSNSLAALQGLPEMLRVWQSGVLRRIAEAFDPLTEVHAHLDQHILPEPSLKLQEGGYIAAGVSVELDQLRELSRNHKDIIAALEARERKATGISSLKVRYNKVFGYYLEAPRLYQKQIPASYIRKQTLVNAERYATVELEELEARILEAEERIGSLEYAMFQELCDLLKGYVRRMQLSAAGVAQVDVLAALALAAREYGYVRPQILPSDAPCRLFIQGGRHAVLECIDADSPFIPNDLELDAERQQIALITGPNMAGKSTVMRQVALIQLMAQLGAFVPAQVAELSIVDRIFTRVGASDNLSRGQSTFMMEMNEAANILNNASANSLIVLDEIGRGTSTYDGISIAWAMVEHLHQLGTLTLFATHYHELTRLAGELPRVQNFSIPIHEEGEGLVFPRKLKRGEADKSYGIQVAKLAGLPAAVIQRAHEVMAGLIADAPDNLIPALDAAEGQGLATHHPALEKIQQLDLDELSPRAAWEFLFKVRGELEQG